MVIAAIKFQSRGYSASPLSPRASFHSQQPNSARGRAGGWGWRRTNIKYAKAAAHSFPLPRRHDNNSRRIVVDLLATLPLPLALFLFL